MASLSVLWHGVDALQREEYQPSTQMEAWNKETSNAQMPGQLGTSLTKVIILAAGNDIGLVPYLENLPTRGNSNSVLAVCHLMKY